jgi:hypothetical protein
MSNDAMTSEIPIAEIDDLLSLDIGPWSFLGTWTLAIGHLIGGPYKDFARSSPRRVC